MATIKPNNLKSLITIERISNYISKLPKKNKVAAIITILPTSYFFISALMVLILSTLDANIDQNNPAWQFFSATIAISFWLSGAGNIFSFAILADEWIKHKNDERYEYKMFCVIGVLINIITIVALLLVFVFSILYIVVGE